LKKGKVTAYLETLNKKKRTITLQRGAIFGVEDMLLDCPRLETAETITECKLYKLTRENLDNMENGDSVFALSCYNAITRMMAITLREIYLPQMAS